MCNLNAVFKAQFQDKVMHCQSTVDTMQVCDNHGIVTWGCCNCTKGTIAGHETSITLDFASYIQVGTHSCVCNESILRNPTSDPK